MSPGFIYVDWHYLKTTFIDTVKLHYYLAF